MLHHRPGSAGGRSSSLGSQGSRSTREESSNWYSDEINSSPQGFRDHSSSRSLNGSRDYSLNVGRDHSRLNDGRDHRYRGSRIDRDIQGRGTHSHCYSSPRTNSRQGYQDGGRHTDGSYWTNSRPGYQDHGRNSDGSYWTNSRQGYQDHGRNSDGSYWTNNSRPGYQDHGRNSDGSYWTNSRQGYQDHGRNGDGSYWTNNSRPGYQDHGRNSDGLYSRQEYQDHGRRSDGSYGRRRQFETANSARWHDQSSFRGMNNVNKPDKTSGSSCSESRPKRTSQDVENIPAPLSSSGADEGDQLPPSLFLGPTETPSQQQLYRRAVLTSSEDEDCCYMVGTCPDMCPGPEREKRARLRDLAVFERLENDQGRTSRELAVKKFCRTFTGKDLKQSDVRPLPVLSQTMEHLLRTMDRHEYSFELIHDFLFDRTRAVRQELSMQRISGKQAVCIMENIVRFHIISERELRQRRVSGRTFDSHLNLQQLMKSLVSLLNLYIMNSKDDDQLGNEAEFSCYYALLNLNQPQQLSLWFKSIRPSLWNAPDMKFARNVLRCYRHENYTGFFRLAKDATYLQSCLLELYFNEVRANAINAINHGAYKLHPYPLVDLANLLLLEVDDAEEFCIVHGLVVGVSPSNEVQLLVKQAEFGMPKQGARHYHCRVIQEKHPPSFQQACAGD